MDGILIINKDKGCTSHDVVRRIKKLFRKKVGHTGTLDPNATGVLPILIGKGTELSQFLINHDKKYIATIHLGIKTDTGDVEGKIIEEKSVKIENLTSENIKSIFESMLGRQNQIPPMYSAIKVKGKKLYEYARSGKTVDIPAREIQIYSLNLLNVDNVNLTITYEIHCSKGTYVRTVCENIAERLETVGYMEELKRTMVGNFLIDDAINIEDLEKNIKNENYLKEKIINVEDFFKEEVSANLDNKQLSLFLNGVQLEKNFDDGIVRIYDCKNNFIGVGMVKDKKLKRKIVL